MINNTDAVDKGRGVADIGKKPKTPGNNGKPVLIEMEGINKAFSGVKVLDNVEFSAVEGEVQALVGENGAGKSTLMKVIAGSFADYEGKIAIGGREVSLRSPAQAKANGIAMIYQELSLALPLGIAENILVGRLPKKGVLLDKQRMLKEAEEYLNMVGLGHLDPMTTVEQISQSEAQLVEIAKALSYKPKILVMDEPTSSLSREEVRRLFKIIKTLKGNGLTIIYISHHLPEIFEIADRISVMRDGKKVATVNPEEITMDNLVELMIGRKFKDSYCHVEKGEVERQELIRVKELYHYGFFHDISFSVEAGEIVGIAGLSGSGRSELAKSICGLDPIERGAIYLAGQKIQPKNIAQALKQGIAYLTEDRKMFGIVRCLSMEENLLAAFYLVYGKFIADPYKKRLQRCRQLIEELKITPPEPRRTVNTLSGGNQQKVLLGKWIAINPKVLILDEPTRGVDIAAKQTIHEMIRKLAQEGKAIILISSDLPELLNLSERILIMRKGHFHGLLQEHCKTEEELLLAISGEGGDQYVVRNGKE